MAEKRDILWRFLGDAKNLNRATQDASRSLTKTERAAGAASTGVSNLTKAAGALGVAFGTREIAQFAWDAAQAAEAAGIVADSFDTTFGPASDRLRENLEETRRIMGLSSAAAETMLLPLGQLAQAMGLNQEEAANFSEQLFVVAGDLAAFDGDLSDTEQALGAVQSALKGEFDPLEQFGVKLKQADINAKALQMTGKKLTSELTNQELAAASLALILEQVGDETGSLMAMQDSAQGQTNQLTSEMEDLRIELGTALVPAIQGATQASLEWIETSKQNTAALGEWAGSAKTAVQWMYEWWTRTNLLGMAFRWLKGQIEELFSPIQKLVDFIKSIPDSLPNPFRNFKIPKLTFPSVPSWVPGFSHSGGVVPGPTGQNKLMVLQGGERVIPRGGSSTDSGPGMTVNINIGVAGDPYAVARQIADLLERYETANGTRISGVGT